MAYVDDTQRTALLARAIEALAVSDNAQSHEIYKEIVESITKLCNKNQKEIANELQQLAKSLESQGNTDGAFEFKQRTCAVMLEISMEDRRRSRPEGAAPQPRINMQPPPPQRTPPSTSSSGSSNLAERIQQETNFDPNVADIKRSASKNKIGEDTGELDAVTSHGAPHDGLTTGYLNDSFDAMNVQGSTTFIDAALPFLNIEYIYLGSADYDRDINYYCKVLGAEEVWNFDRFGSRITAVSLCAGPLILIADHRHAPSCQPVFRVADLSATARDLMARGWKPISGPFGTPNGEAYSFADPSGNKFAIFQVDETSTDRAYFDPTENE